MLNSIKSYYNHSPLTFILLIGLLFRMISAIFSTGYGMHDDHFLVIEAAQSWVDGFDYNNWLPGNSPTGEPTGHSFFYVGLHYLFFYFCDIIGLQDAQFKMFVIRLLHGLWSLLTVFFGYKITEKLSNTDNAKIVGLLLAVLWFYPILSVRNMVEMVCIPFMLISFWYLLKDNISWKHYLIAGVFVGLSIAVRMQTYLIFGGIGLVLLYERKLVGAILFGISSGIALFVTQMTDLFLWGYPFAEMAQYVLYNSTHYDEYITQSWFQYFLLIGGLLIPPVSLFLLFGFFKQWKKSLLLFFPAFLFLVFHSIYPNKQERFILPIMPFIIILGVIGWRAFFIKSEYWIKRPKFYKGILSFFWTLNIVALLFISPASSKKSRVESMYYLSSIPDVTGIFLERNSNYGCYLMPRYYHGLWNIKHYCLSKDNVGKFTSEDIRDLASNSKINYCLFIEEKEVEDRVGKMERIFPKMKLIKKIEPSYMDKLLHFLNPVNENENIYIYKLY